MCMEDIRMGRSSGTAAKTILLPAGVATNLVGPSEKRTRLTVSCNGTGTFYLAPQNSNPAIGEGISLSASIVPLTLTVEDYGSILFGSWSIASLGAAGGVTVFDTSLERQ